MSANKTAVLLVNLGTPDAPDSASVRRYLKEFLSDPRVVEGKGARRLLWLAVLNGIILTVRPPKVAKLYASIWQEDSPMRMILNQQVAKLQFNLQQQFDRSPQVFSAMTYGTPGLSSRLQELAGNGFEQILIVPMYPQYSATTTAPIYDQVAKFQSESRKVLDIRIVRQFYDHPLYIRALANSVRQSETDRDLLLVSYHGIPQEYVDKGDPYQQQCLKTSELLAEELGLQSSQLMSTFQSRFGPKQWLTPYTDETLEGLPDKGIKKVQVLCPAFTADCLETLEEIAVENCEVFDKAGGEQYDYIPALNDNDDFIEMLQALVESQAGDWLQEKI